MSATSCRLSTRGPIGYGRAAASRMEVRRHESGSHRCSPEVERGRPQRTYSADVVELAPGPGPPGGRPQARSTSRAHRAAEPDLVAAGVRHPYSRPDRPGASAARRRIVRRAPGARVRWSASAGRTTTGARLAAARVPFGPASWASRRHAGALGPRRVPRGTEPEVVDQPSPSSPRALPDLVVVAPPDQPVRRRRAALRRRAAHDERAVDDARPSSWNAVGVGGLALGAASRRSRAGPCGGGAPRRPRGRRRGGSGGRRTARTRSSASGPARRSARRSLELGELVARREVRRRGSASAFDHRTPPASADGEDAALDPPPSPTAAGRRARRRTGSRARRSRAPCRRPTASRSRRSPGRRERRRAT